MIKIKRNLEIRITALNLSKIVTTIHNNKRNSLKTKNGISKFSDTIFTYRFNNDILFLTKYNLKRCSN